MACNKNTNYMHMRLQARIPPFENLLWKWRTKANRNKPQVFGFFFHQVTFSFPPLNESPVEFGREEKYLGIISESNFTWSK